MGAGGGHGPRAQALEGAPAQLVGANFKKKIRPRQISKDRLSIFYPGVDAGFTKWGGGAPIQACIGPRALETLATPLCLGYSI